MTGTAPLAGLRVLERTTSVAGQSAGMLLADLGADVVRLVPGGDVERTGLPGWLCWNRGKTLLGDGAAGDTAGGGAGPHGGLDALLARADVLLVDAPRAELAAAGLDPVSLRARAPSLVDVWLPATGARGRWADLPHDQLLLDALSGFAAHHPATAELPVTSVVATRHRIQGVLAGVAALAGVLARERDGWGRSAIVSGLHAEGATLCTFVARAIDGPEIMSAGKLLPGAPNYRLYRAGDGRWLFLAALSPELFIRALEALDRLDVFARPDVAGDFLNMLRPDVGPAVGAELEATFATATADEWVARLQAADVPAAPAMDPAAWLEGDVIAHACPPLRRDHPTLGPVVQPGPPLQLSADPPRPGELPVPGVLGDTAGVWRDVPPRPAPAGPPPGPGDRPLAGVRVIDMATFLAGPLVGTLLAGHGADVVKLESPSGDPYAVYNVAYAALNEHKPRLTVDLAGDAGRARFLELVAEADVVVDNLLSSSFERLGLGPERFVAANPRLVRCSVTAYGADGPYAELPGFDNIMQTLSGLVTIQGGAGQPVATAAPAHDVATGALGALGTLAALWARRRPDGPPVQPGQRVFASLAATSTYLQAAELTAYAGRPPRRVGGPDFPGPSSYERFYRAADRWLAVSATTPEQRAAMDAALGEVASRVPGDPASRDPDDARATALAARFAAQPVEHWLGLLGAAGVPCCPAIERFELDDPFLVENDYSHAVDTPHVGRLQIIGGFTAWQHTDRRPPLPVAEQATDDAEVLGRWRGVSDG